MRTPDYPTGSQAQWSAVDAYFADLLAPEDDVLRAARIASAEAGLPPHAVSPVQGKLLALLVRIAGARRVLEIGTLGGYSSIWLARALPPEGRLVTIEADPRHAAVAAANLARAGLTHQVALLQGRALDLLPALDEAFDLVFIDADKPSNPYYLDHALRLTRPGSLIVADNVVRGGAVVDPASDDPGVRGVRTFLERVAADPRLDATALQLAGEKGWDGFALAVVKAA